MRLTCNFISDNVPLTWETSAFGFESVPVEDTVTISCRTSRPLHEVSLWFKYQNDAKYKKVVDGTKIQQKCQQFTVNNVDPNDSGYYYCRTDGLKEMRMGMLYVDLCKYELLP